MTLLPKLILTKYVNNPVDINSLWMVLLGRSPNGGMWFLWHLFLISVVFLCVMKFLNKTSDGAKTAVVMTIGVIGYCFYEFNKTGILGYTNKFAIFFSIGIVLGRYYPFAKRYFNLLPAMILLAADLIIACPKYNISVAYVVTGVLGFYGLYTIGIHLHLSNTTIRRVMDYLGTNAHGIYLLSYFGQIPLRIILYSKMQLPYWICVCAMFIGGMIIPVIGMQIIRKNKLLRVLALGESGK